MKKICILGGDARLLFVKEFFQDKGYNVSSFGLDESSKYDDISKAVSKCDIVIMPLPITRDKIRLNAPFFIDKPPKLIDICNCLPENTSLFGGQISDDVRDACISKSIKVYDYFLDEALTIKNAYLSAEAAIEIAMHECKGTIASSKCMIIGYGRIGKFLTELLLRLNSSVTVAARRKTDRVLAECYGAYVLDISNANSNALLDINDGYDIVFNTVPQRIFTDNIIYKLKKEVCIIDLASAPGGIDIRKARDAGLNVIWALSLPGKYSPKIAGKIISESIYSTMKEEGLC